MTPQYSETVQRALAQRLRSLAVARKQNVPARQEDPARDAGSLLFALAESVSREAPTSDVWALYTAVGAVFPREDAVIRLVRQWQLGGPAGLAQKVLDAAIPDGAASGNLSLEGDFVENAVLVDVDFSATNEHNTGVQRVVRNTVATWERNNEALLVASRGGAYRALTDSEHSRVTRFDDERPGDDAQPAHRLLFPLSSTVILTEVPAEAHLEPLASLARFSGNRVAAIGYDAIPFTSRETVSRREMIKFAKYLSVIKHAHHVSGISDAAAMEFQGFKRMVRAQGLAGPIVTSCPLPSITTLSGSAGHQAEADPMILVVGSKEPRKNHVAVLFAAEQLWRQGLRFRLRFAGNYGWDTREFRRWFRRLARAGRPVEAPRWTSDRELAALYDSARFTVFPSLHEGYGLPVVESLSRGVPVITTGYGSTAEIAKDGGCLLVDPRLDDSLVMAMGDLLRSDELHSRLVGEARSRPVRSWDDYAVNLWSQFMSAR